MMGTKINGTFGELMYGEDDILFLKSSNSQLVKEDYLALFDAMKQITNGRKLPYIADERGNNSFLDKDTKKVLSENLYKYVTACAIIEDSTITRFLTHTFIAIYRPKVPLKLFKTVEEAKVWLVDFKKVE